LLDATADIKQIRRFNASRRGCVLFSSAEVRVPFNTVLLGLDALMTEVTDRPELLGDVRLMKQAAEMMLRVLNDSLDIEKMRAGQYTLEFKEGSLLNVLHGVLRSMEPWARQDRVGLFLEIRPGIPHNVLCDANRLTQALLNLVSNAVKFVPHDGTGWVKVRAFRITGPSARRSTVGGVVYGSGSRSTVGSGSRGSPEVGSAEEASAAEMGSPGAVGAPLQFEPAPPFSWQRPLTWPLALLWVFETGLGRASDAMHICMCSVLVSIWDNMLALLRRGWLRARNVLVRCGVVAPLRTSDAGAVGPGQAHSASAGDEVVVPGPTTTAALAATPVQPAPVIVAAGTSGAVAADSVAIDVGAESGASSSSTAANAPPPTSRSRWWPWRRRARSSAGGAEAAGGGAVQPPAHFAEGGAGSPSEQPLGRTRGGGALLTASSHITLPAGLRIRAHQGRKGANATAPTPAPAATSSTLAPPLQAGAGGVGTGAPHAQVGFRLGNTAGSGGAAGAARTTAAAVPGPGTLSESSAPPVLGGAAAARAAKLERVWIRFEVQDNGVGIKPEDQVKLFTAFHQIEAGALQKGGGSGLGLSICKEIVRRHGGAVGVHSAPGQGSTFYAEVSCEVVELCRWRRCSAPSAPTSLPKL
jgi:signal transduction histidine kinase